MLLKRLKELAIPALLSLIFIVLTGLIGGDTIPIPFLQQFCFMFHLIPFGIGFAGGDTYQIILYYLVLWLVLSLLFLGIKHLIRPMRVKT